MANVGKLIRELGIECDLREVETVDAWTDQEGWEDVLEALKKSKEVIKGKVEESVLTKHQAAASSGSGWSGELPCLCIKSV